MGQEKNKGGRRQKERERNIPLSEDFEIGFCLKVSEREKEKGEKKETERLTD